MIRKLLLPAVAIALLGGCMTGGYSYRQDRGDYYYGAPGVDYRYHGSPYGYPGYRYGYPGYSGYPWGYGGYYGGYPYRPYYPGYPYYPYPYRPRPPMIVVPRPDDDPPPRPPRDDDRDDRRPPWRNLDNLVRRRGDDGLPRIEPSPISQSPPRTIVTPPMPPPRAVVRSRDPDARDQPVRRRPRDEPEREIE